MSETMREPKLIGIDELKIDLELVAGDIDPRAKVDAREAILAHDVAQRATLASLHQRVGEMEQEKILIQACADAHGAKMLELQQECIEANKQLAEVTKERDNLLLVGRACYRITGHYEDDLPQAIAARCEEIIVNYQSQLATQAERVKGLEGALDKLLPPIIDNKMFEQAPCYRCGYNGPLYFQPDTHKCAEKYHKQQQALNESGR